MTEDATNYSHLSELALEYIHRSDDERKRFICQDKWIALPFAEQAIKRIEELLFFPKNKRMTCLLIHGESSMGKSHILDRVRKKYSAGIQRRDGGDSHPILALQLVATPDEKRVMSAITRSLKAPTRNRETIESLERVISNVFARIKPAALFLDEFNNIDACSRQDQKKILNFFKYLSNEYRMPVIAFGTSLSVSIIGYDPQISRRFETFLLPTWSLNEEFIDFVASLVATYPLRKKSHVIEPRLCREILEVCDGVTGEVEKLLRRAALKAVGGEERITPSIISEVIDQRWL
ncbi:TniB family NTP-binding protein [Terasakiella pusilla]|uniref:TniB family NTP-binding protein n=1 Tax=Terasakiella pusilla TaxID=64973 RepID=UPI0004915E8D|nr:TniB family NTP-binding protein [Terasakiella pusilla]